MLAPKVTVYFDGVCGLCNQFVDFLVEQDKNDRFRFAPLQSQLAKKTLPPKYTEGELGTVVVEYDGKFYYKSKAVLVALSKLSSWGFLFKAGLIMPQVLADRIYDFVAKRRYAWFGRLEQCRLPAPQEKHKFLD